MSDNIKTAEQLAREALVEITNPKGRSDEQCIGYIVKAILRYSAQKDARIKELEDLLAKKYAMLPSGIPDVIRTNTQLESENATLRKRVEEYRIAMASNLCSAHAVSEPLTCDVCNLVKWLENANDARMKRVAELESELRAEQSRHYAQYHAQKSEIQSLEKSRENWTDTAGKYLDEVARLQKRVKELENLLRYIYERGGYVCDIHDRIVAALSPNPTTGGMNNEPIH